MPALFVYGTLRPGGSNHGLLEDAVSHTELAHADGLALYATRGFPYAAPDTDLVGERVPAAPEPQAGAEPLDRAGPLDRAEPLDARSGGR